MNIVDLVFEQCDRGAVALVSGGYSLTYSALAEAVERTAEALLKAGLPKRSERFVPRVGLACPNGPEHVILALAVLRAGACLVPVASELAPPEREALIRTVGVHALVLADGMTWRERLAQRERVVKLPEFQATFFLEPQRSALDLGFDEAAFAGLDPAFIRFSSGTTGEAKGVVLSHASLLARIETGNRRMGITPRDKVVWILPMAHHFAVSIMLYLLKGATTLLVQSHLAEDILDAALRHGGTVLYGAPFHHALLAREVSGRPWPMLRLAVSTAAALPMATALAFDDRYGVPLSQGFGIIEVGLPLLNTAAPREKPQSVGRPLDDIAVAFRDPDTGEEVPEGEVGELFLQAKGMLDAYLNPWRLRQDVLVDGRWFRTGDLARQDSDGCVHLVGRIKSVINVAGMKCFPEEVEAVLQTHPGVRAAYVSGREHPHYGAVPVADVVTCEPQPSAASLAEHCRNALARYKVPVEFHFVRELPRTSSGKIRRI